MSDENISPLGEDLVRATVRAAEHDDRLAFAALAQRLGSLEQAQQIVRKDAFVRMSDRVGNPRHVQLLRQPELRSDPSVSEDPVLFGHFAVFNEWTEIDSIFEGHFLERIAPGAFTKTFQEQTPKPMFQHGSDPFLGDKIIGKPQRLEQDAIGAYYEVSLFRGLPDLLLDGLRAGSYGASFRFRAMREVFQRNVKPSEYNPEGLDERTLKETQVPEFGPVTFPAYSTATAGLRHANGDGEEFSDAPSNSDAAEEAHPQNGRRAGISTSVEERREPYTWQLVLREEYRRK